MDKNKTPLTFIFALVAFIMLNVVDSLLTYKALELGCIEVNLSIRFLMGELGYWGAAVVKLLIAVVVGWSIGMWRLWVLQVVTIAMVVVVMCNVIMILAQNTLR